MTGSSDIQFVVGTNPFRQGTYLAGTGLEIVAPVDLREVRPDVVIVMNSIYTHEIREMLTDLDLSPKITTL